MASEEDGLCAPPPFFQGDPLEEVVEAPTSFPWQDLLEGTGDFCIQQAPNNRQKWKQMSSTTKGGVSVTTYSRSVEEKGGLCEFLIRGCLPIARDTYFCVNADMEYRPEWDTTCVSLAELSSSGPGPEAGPFVERERVLHWNVSYPWPLGKRDYVLEQTVLSLVHPDGRVFRCTQGRTVDPQVGKRLRPCKKGVTRIEDYRAHMAIWSGATEQESCFALLYFEDGKLNVPTWVLTKAAATTIPSQLAAVVPVAAKYPKMRAQHLLARYASSIASGEAVVSGDDEAFYSASDDDSPTRPLRPSMHKMSSTKSLPSVSPKHATASPAPSPLSSRSHTTEHAQASPKLMHAMSINAVASPITMHAQHAQQASPKPLHAQAATGSKTLQAQAVTASKKRGLTSQAKKKNPHSRLEKALRSLLPNSESNKVKVKDDSDEGDLEEGVLMVGKEERDLLLNLLAEARAKQSGSWWMCPCRRRCSKGHKQ